MKISEITNIDFVQQGLDSGSIAHAIRHVDLGASDLYSNLNRAGMQLLNHKLQKEEWSIIDLPIRRLIAIQSNVNPDYRQSSANRRSTDTDEYVYPCVIHFRDKLFIFDGHHRVADAAAAGQQVVRCRVVDMNEPADPRQGVISLPSH